VSLSQNGGKSQLKLNVELEQNKKWRSFKAAEGTNLT